MRIIATYLIGKIEMDSNLNYHTTNDKIFHEYNIDPNILQYLHIMTVIFHDFKSSLYFNVTNDKHILSTNVTMDEFVINPLTIVYYEFEFATTNDLFII